jgi:hypothetical protein
MHECPYKQQARNPLGTALFLTIAALGSALMMHRGYVHLSESGALGPAYQRREEKPRTMSYESSDIEKLAQSALQKRGVQLSDSEKELHRMDRDSNCTITESEVLYYIRNK